MRRAVRPEKQLFAPHFFFENMKKTVFLLTVLAVFAACTASKSVQKNAENEIRRIMAAQESAWNAGDLDRFMIGYWPSDSLVFVGSSGLTRGWSATLSNYKKGYPDRAAMGRLRFDLLKIDALSKNAAHIIGKWHLERPEKGNVGGHFTLLWRKIDGKWVIVADHSS